MQRFFLTITLILSALYTNAQPPKLQFPLEGTLNKDFFIANYVDHDTNLTTIIDPFCGSQTYDGHQGTDIVLKNYKQMDSGVYILAAAKGKIMTVVQNTFSRNKTASKSMGYGNYITIDHGGYYYTVYAHLRQNSALVKVGDSVKAGQRIAFVGCAGYCLNPHLHFELWTGYTIIDPFKGTCSLSSGYWISQPAYDTSFNVIDQGLIPFVATYDTIREHLSEPPYFDKPDTAITYWVQALGLKKGDVTRFEWYTPSGTLWYGYNYNQLEDDRYFFNWTWLKMPTIQGKWKVIYKHNGTQKSSKDFWVGKATSIDAPMNAQSDVHPIVVDKSIIINDLPPNASLSIYDISGQLIQQTISKSSQILQNGLYIIHIQSVDGVFVEKVVVR